MKSVRRQSTRILQNISPFRPQSSLTRSPIHTPEEHATPVVQSQAAISPSSQMDPEPVSQRSPQQPLTPAAVQCPKCSREVGNTGVNCDLGDNWFHLKCAGLGGILNDTYKCLGKYDCVKIFCPTCLAKISAFCADPIHSVNTAVQTDLNFAPRPPGSSSPHDISVVPVVKRGWE